MAKLKCDGGTFDDSYSIPATYTITGQVKASYFTKGTVAINK